MSADARTGRAGHEVARHAGLAGGHLVTIGKLGATGGSPTENTELIRELVRRAPITTRQFVEDFKAVFS